MKFRYLQEKAIKAIHNKSETLKITVFKINLLFVFTHSIYNSIISCIIGQKESFISQRKYVLYLNVINAFLYLESAMVVTLIPLGRLD